MDKTHNRNSQQEHQPETNKEISKNQLDEIFVIKPIETQEHKLLEQGCIR